MVAAACAYRRCQVSRSSARPESYHKAVMQAAGVQVVGWVAGSVVNVGSGRTVQFTTTRGVVQCVGRRVGMEGR